MPTICIRYYWGDETVKKKATMVEEKLELTLDPEQRMCPLFDAVSIGKFQMARYKEMGVRVLDNCCEEHTM